MDDIPTRFSPPQNLSVPSPAAATGKSAEDIWRDINNLNILKHHRHTPFSIPNPILHDFMSGGIGSSPFSKDPPTKDSFITIFGSRTRADTSNTPTSLTLYETTGPRTGDPDAMIVFPALGCPKRVLEMGPESCDQRHKRLMKSRESAARSRARQQAYTSELELEVARLQQENSKLRRQQEELMLAATVVQVPKKYGLYRTLTCPF